MGCVIAQAPLRLPLGGGGTDVPEYYREHGGLLLAAALALAVTVIVRTPPLERGVRLSGHDHTGWLDPEDIPNAIVRAALARTQMRRRAIEITSLGDVPSGTGLGSSGAFAVALVAALRTQHGNAIEPTKIAEEAYCIERDDVGALTGKQDHYIASYGGIRELVIHPDGRVECASLAISAAARQRLGERLIMYYTGIRRASSDALHDQFGISGHLDRAVVENLHTIKAIGMDIRDALLRGDLDAFGELLDHHWRVKQARSRTVSSSAIDAWYAAARSAGALGGKLMGAGNGGFLLFCCRSWDVEAVRASLTSHGLIEVPFGLDPQGVRVVFTS